MLGILLKILSIIGISLLVILLLILLIVVVVLFSPITYRVRGEKLAGEDEGQLPFWGKVKVTYLFGMIRVYFDYPDPGKLIMKFLCFKIYDSSKPKNEKTKKEKNKKEKTKKEKPKKEKVKEQKEASGQEIKTEIKNFEPDQSQKEQLPEEISERTEENLENIENLADISLEKDEDVIKDDKDSAEKKKTSILSKIKGFFEKIRSLENKLRNFLHKTQDKAKAIKEKCKKVYDEVCFYKDLATCEIGKQFLDHVKKRVIKILKTIKPRKYQIDIEFGADSPDITGYVVAAYGMVLSKVKRPNCFYLRADFTQSIFAGKFDIRGHFILFTIVYNGLRLLLDKNFKRLRRKIKKHKQPKAKAA